MRHTIVQRQTQLVGIGDSLVRVRVKIDGIAVHLHLRKQLFANQFGPYLLHRRLGMIIKRDFRNPRRGSIRRVRQNDIIPIHDAHTGNHKGGAVSCCHTVELIRGRIIFDIGLVAVTTRSTNGIVTFGVQIVRGVDAGAIDTRISGRRPTFG